MGCHHIIWDHMVYRLMISALILVLLEFQIHMEQKTQGHCPWHECHHVGVFFNSRRGYKGDGSLDLGWWTHNTDYRWYTIELYTWHLYNFINQCHSNKFNKKFKKSMHFIYSCLKGMAVKEGRDFQIPSKHQGLFHFYKVIFYTSYFKFIFYFKPLK